jgi:hypothetical protein
VFQRNDANPLSTSAAALITGCPAADNITSNPRSSIPTDPDALLTRDAAAAALTAAGFPTSPATLATKVSRGNGPEYQKYGQKPLYRWGPLLSWAQSRLTAPRRSSSEGDA